ncbi:MAG: glycosyltransferase [Lachnospiraceae bacterium]|nr:glycosyltransferase [Lachnospiraceae bacterium]
MVYSIIVMFLYPFLIGNEFGFWYIASLVFTLASNTFMQYSFGWTWMILLVADQKAYVKYCIETFIAFINLLLTVFLIQKGFSIQAVKLAAAVVFIAKPFLLSVYVKRNYNIDRKIKLNGEPMFQMKSFFKRIITLKRLKRNNDYDACISFMDSANIANILTGKRHCKTIVSVRNTLSQSRSKEYKYIVNPIAKLLYSHTDKVIALSKGTEWDLKENLGVPEKNLQQFIMDTILI